MSSKQDIADSDTAHYVKKTPSYIYTVDGFPRNLEFSNLLCSALGPLEAFWSTEILSAMPLPRQSSFLIKLKWPIKTSIGELTTAFGVFLNFGAEARPASDVVTLRAVHGRACSNASSKFFTTQNVPKSVSTLRKRLLTCAANGNNRVQFSRKSRRFSKARGTYPTTIQRAKSIFCRCLGFGFISFCRTGLALAR